MRVILLLVFVSAYLSAQEQSSLSGRVTDESGGVIATAVVVVSNVDTNAQRDLVTDAYGRFIVASLPVGNYSIVVSKQGFKTKSLTGIRLVVGQEGIENLTLPIGDLQQTVTVEEHPESVALSTDQISGLVGEKEVKDLPLNGRSYDELLSLNPGIINYSSEKSGGVGQSQSAVGNMFSVSGRRPQESIFLLNGIEYTSASEINLTPGGASGQLLGVDAVREFNVIADAYGADYGKRPGAQVSVVTSSGTNAIHGSVYEFLRNSDLDARNFYDQANIAPFKRNEFGGAFGGPIQKDKTFIFGNYEGFRQSLGLSAATLVPDNCVREGMLSNASGVCSGKLAISPIASKLLSLWPIQNGASLGGGIGYAYSNPLQSIREDFGTTRVDHVFSAKDTLSGVYTIDDSADTTPSADPLTTLFESLREQVASVEETHVFSSRIVNTARFGFSRANFLFNSSAPDPGYSFIQGLPIGAIVIGGGTANNGASQISQAGNNSAVNTVAVRNLFTYEDQVDLTLGAHHVQAGVWFQRIQSNDNFAQAQYGQATFTSLGNFLAGKVGTFTAVPNSTELGWRSLESAGYLQDTWKVNSRLELKVGLRIEATDGWNEAHSRASNYLFSNGVLETHPQVGTSALAVNRAKFLPEPRVGLAWDVFGHGKTIVHAGFGLYHGLLDDLSYRLDQNAPFNTTYTVKNTTLPQVSIVPGAPLPKGGLVSPAGVQPDLYTPTVISYTFKVEQKLSNTTALGVGYVGSHGYHEILSVDANEPFPTYRADGSAFYPKGAPYANPLLANSTTWLSEGVSSYNALQLDVNRRFEAGLQIRGVYTWSKSLDDGDSLATAVGANAPAFVMFPLNTKLDWGRSNFDATQAASINATYDLPFGHGRKFGNSFKPWTDRALGGWSIASVVTVQTGFPFTPQLGFNPTNNGDSRNPIRPSWNPSFTGPVILGDPHEYYNPDAFVVPANGTYGNAARNVLQGPGMTTVDFSALKIFVITERVKLQFRSEFFNLLNHTNFATPNPVVFTSAAATPSSTAGVISATSTTSRQIQFGLKLLW
ncbi:MAG TPA: carboxypeptidase regulatory-like domain-containing protein [Bryobacteraceae bacterium]|nr:carboxypeptidase regulatory-like domain-containing protein [Bryobacteraceae bacterium]